MSSAQDYTKQLQIVQNFFIKCVQIVADARLSAEDLRSNVSPLIPSSSAANTNKWFNLELPELEFLQEPSRPWKTVVPGELPPPLVIECYLDPSKLRPGQTVVLGDRRCNTNSEIVSERWIIECKPPTAGTADLTATEDSPVLYKRAIVSVRSLYTASRLLPTWQLHQRLSKQKLISVPSKLGIKLHNGSMPISSKGRIGLSKSIDGKKSTLQQFRSSPLVTPIGTLHCGVTYRDDVRYGVEDIEKVMAQKFMESDSPNTSRSASAGSTASASAGATPGGHNAGVGSAGVPGSTPSTDNLVSAAAAGSSGSTANVLGRSSSSSLGPKPILNFTRPFKSPGTEDSAAYSPRSTPIGTPNSAQIAPQSITGSVSSVVSTSSRFSSSFASQRTPGQAPRSYSNDGGHRGASVSAQSTHASHGGTGSSTNLAHLGSYPGSDMYMAQTDIGDFVKYVDETSRSGLNKIKPKVKPAEIDVDSSLSRFQRMRSSHIQLSDSILQNLPTSSASPQNCSAMSQRRQSKGECSQRTSSRRSSSNLHDSKADQEDKKQAEQENQDLSDDDLPTLHQRQEQSRLEEKAEEDSDHKHELPQQQQQKQQQQQQQQQETLKPMRKRSSGGRRSRSGFYAEQDDDDNDVDDNDSDMLFALSDVHI